ncbi:hypothetical protein FISHEDRAFT_59531 [Fistulina hepatica ATCC 64428]|uniref:Uncharacterized protein n=1 Tax=Fistulina hepatica ATCC 64428 TaxID=1128425 RepID=A0A0D7AAV6_9AGAR|nr:hypothetical protein FISHEDRAFT_59531 [Fistulina hepatica ATCC 64428]
MHAKRLADAVLQSRTCHVGLEVEGVAVVVRWCQPPVDGAFHQEQRDCVRIRRLQRIPGPSASTDHGEITSKFGSTTACHLEHEFLGGHRTNIQTQEDQLCGKSLSVYDEHPKSKVAGASGGYVGDSRREFLTACHRKYNRTRLDGIRKRHAF